MCLSATGITPSIPPEPAGPVISAKATKSFQALEASVVYFHWICVDDFCNSISLPSAPFCPVAPVKPFSP